ncbi:major membrane immunogen (membrane-anchored lipoprotein) [Chitinivorax tropicus]|uniref:Major membrane immunogen (Membrane-anchored lipoprotein) n=1 Tax=Chitinivorax tropicus TaxID=714531 RepID=A0A840MNQ5_9PROT|nr:hypothetical protein [Chitinivorax tropicus]MBB5018136.1 major membrane immunogen (membrane-anchored lipoprotein) [Chitinivorax tropicus]
MRIYSIIILAVLLSACGKRDEPPVAIYQHEREQLDKAKAIEQTFQKADQDQRKAIDEASGAEKP